MRFKAVVFDLDGTLLDTLEDLADAVNQALIDMGFPTHPKRAYRYFAGNGSRTMVARAIPEDARSEKTIDRCLDIYKSYYDKNWNAKSGPYPGVPKMLDALFATDLKLAILTNKLQEFADRTVHALLGSWSFSIVEGQRDASPPKPDPAGALRIVEAFAVDPAECLFVGDSGVDMETAKRARMFPAGAMWGFRDRQELEANGAKALVYHPLEIVDLLE